MLHCGQAPCATDTAISNESSRSFRWPGFQYTLLLLRGTGRAERIAYTAARGPIGPCSMGDDPDR
jgi:hypothetical protein